MNVVLGNFVIKFVILSHNSLCLLLERISTLILQPMC